MTDINLEKKFAIENVKEIQNGRLAPVGGIERRTFLFIELVKNMDVDIDNKVCIFARDFQNLFIFTKELYEYICYLAKYDKVNIITNTDSKRLLELGGCVRKLSEEKADKMLSSSTCSFALFPNNCSIYKLDRKASAAIASGDEESYAQYIEVFNELWEKSLRIFV